MESKPPGVQDALPERLCETLGMIIAGLSLIDDAHIATFHPGTSFEILTEVENESAASEKSRTKN